LVFNSDQAEWGGSGLMPQVDILVISVDREQKKVAITITLPPLAGLVLA